MEGLGSFNQSDQHESERREVVANTLEEKMAKLRAIPHVAQAMADRKAKIALELERHGVPVTPKQQVVLRATDSSVSAPTTMPVKHFSEVDQPELVPDGNGGWIRKDEV